MRLPWGATIASLCGVAILIGLGTWQIERLHWKTAIIEKLNAGYDGIGEAAPIAPEQFDTWAKEKSPVGYGVVAGKLIRDKSVLLGGRVYDGRPGFHLLVPMMLKDGHILIINTGWVDELWADNTEDRLSALPADNEIIVAAGAIHRPDWSSFSSKNAPSHDMWFRADIEQIAAERNITTPYPFILYADSIEPPLQGILPHEQKWLPRNKHLQYAIFWYALAVCLMSVYGFYIAGLNKKKAP